MRGKRGGRPAASPGGGSIDGTSPELGESVTPTTVWLRRRSEENEANPSRGSEGATTAWGLAWLG